VQIGVLSNVMLSSPRESAVIFGCVRDALSRGGPLTKLARRWCVRRCAAVAARLDPADTARSPFWA
jgi:hypothetical protein